MREEEDTATERNSLSEGGEVYEIRVRGHLDDTWVEWFSELAMTHEEGGTTALTGPVADQPALHGLLIKIRDLGLVLVSLNRIWSDPEGVQGSQSEAPICLDT